MTLGRTYSQEPCGLCNDSTAALLWANDHWQILDAQNDDYPVYFLLVSKAHVQEFSALSTSERLQCVSLLYAIESAIIANVKPTKVNLASLGNYEPHLHWHIIGRFEWDVCFPKSIWGTAQRPPNDLALAKLMTLRTALERDMIERIEAISREAQEV